MQNLAKFCTEGSWLFDENNDVSIDNSHILVLLYPFDGTADVTEKKPVVLNGITLCATFDRHSNGS